MRSPCEKPVVEFHRVAVLLYQPLPAVFAGEDLPASIGIAKKLTTPVPVFDQKVTGHPYSDDRKVDAPRHFYVNRRKGYGDASAAVQDVVKKTIARIVIVIRIAAKSVIVEQNAVDPAYGIDRRV